MDETTAAPEGAETVETVETSEAEPEEQVVHDGPVPREIHQRQIAENKAYREKWGRFEKAFAPFGDDADIWLDVAAALKDNPEAAADWMIATAAQVKGVDPATLLGEQPSEEEAPEYLTRDQLLEVLSERDRKAEADKALDDVYHRAEALGYQRDTREITNLLWLATHETDGDLDAAHKILEGDHQKVIDDYLANKRDAAASTPRVATAGTTPGSQHEIKSLKDARAAMEDYLAQL